MYNIENLVNISETCFCQPQSKKCSSNALLSTLKAEIIEFVDKAQQSLLTQMSKKWDHCCYYHCSGHYGPCNNQGKHTHFQNIMYTIWLVFASIHPYHTCSATQFLLLVLYSLPYICISSNPPNWSIMLMSPSLTCLTESQFLPLCDIDHRQQHHHLIMIINSKNILLQLTAYWPSA